jgi:hypothetical protein
MAARVTKPTANPSGSKSRRTAAATGPIPAAGAAPLPRATDEEIRRLAYLKWEAAGRPEGDGFNFWVEAEQELNGGR